jgi:hypothetical protein
VLGDTSAVRPLLELTAPTLAKGVGFLRSRRPDSYPASLALVFLSRAVPRELAEYAFSGKETRDISRAAARILESLGWYCLWNGDTQTLEYCVQIYWKSSPLDRARMLLALSPVVHYTGGRYRATLEPMLTDAMENELTAPHAKEILERLEPDRTAEWSDYLEAVRLVAPKGRDWINTVSKVLGVEGKY